MTPEPTIFGKATHAPLAADTMQIPTPMGIRHRWLSFWFAPEPPDRLALTRVFFFGLLFIAALTNDYSGWSTLPPTFRTPIWLFDTLHLGIPSDELLLPIAWAWKASLLLAAMGLFTRVSTVMSAVFGIYLIGLPYNFGKTQHATAVAVFALIIMAFSRCGDARSLDRIFFSRNRARIGERFAPRAPGGEYRWPIRMVWLVMSLAFFAAGYAKLTKSGWHWVSSGYLGSLMIQKMYDPTSPPAVSWGPAIAAVPWLVKVFAATVLLGELLFPLALFSRRARWVLPALLFFIQIGIGLFMGIWFVEFLFVYTFWVPWDRMLGSDAASEHFSDFGPEIS